MRSKKLLSAVATLAMLATWVMPAAAQSTVANSVNQDVFGYIVNGGFQEGELEDNAFQNATGSIGMNNAGGNLNQQANQLYIDQTATELTLSGENTQYQFDSTVDFSPSNGNFYSSGNNEATYEDNAFQKASGNIGANNAGGNLNQQQNTATILSSCNNKCGAGPELQGGNEPEISLDQTTGNLGIDGSSGSVNGPFSGSNGSNLASYDDHAFAGASGNIGANNAAGNMNQQGNQLVMVTNGEMENLQVDMDQNNAGQDSNSDFTIGNSVANDTNNQATFDGSAFSTAKGNIGVNNAAGDMNQQSNQAVLNVAASPAPTATQPPEGTDPIAPTTLKLEQTSTGSVTNAGEQQAEFEGNAFQNASGNIGANNAAGSLNQQQNQLYLDVLAEEAALTIANSQNQDGVTVAPDPSGANAAAGFNEATLEDNAFQTANGNIGVNNAAGNANQQQNGAAIFSNTCVSSCGGGPELQNGAEEGATISISQESGTSVNDSGNTITGLPDDGANTATFEDNAFQAATGNIGANNAAGNANQQANELVLVTNGELEGVGLSVDQTSSGNSVNHDTGNIATFDGNAFANATGNVGVNNAAGDLNQQSNVAVMNVAAKSTTAKVNEGSDPASNVDNSFSQSLSDTTVYDAGNQEAEFEGNAFSSATGNIGVNNAGGTQNQQSNALYIDQLAENVNLSVDNNQEMSFVFMDSGDANGNQEATYEDSVFANASGNIGVNNAGGNGNQQQNSATILSNVCGDPACGKSLSVSGNSTGSELNVDQFAIFNSYDGSGGPTPGESEGNNLATFEDNSFQNAKGNIGANNAAGNMNQQSNMMVLITNAALSSLGAHISQGSIYNGVTNDTGNIANFQGNAFQNASGNVSANNAAGDLNQQANQTIINTKP